MLRAACARSGTPGGQVLTARGLALEGGFSYGIVRQLIEPVRAAAGPGEWDGLLDGAAGLAARVFDGAEAGPVEDDVPYAVMHGLYWLVAILAARGPLVIAVDDAHWGDAPSLRWLAHLAARIEGLPVALLLAVRSGPGQPTMVEDVVGELRACPAGTPPRLGLLEAQATAALVRQRLGARADDRLCQACHARTGGNPFLLEALASALRVPGGGDLLARVDSLGRRSASRCTCCAANRPGMPACWSCCARRPSRPAAAALPAWPRSTFAARSTSHPIPRPGPQCSSTVAPHIIPAVDVAVVEVKAARRCDGWAGPRHDAGTPGWHAVGSSRFACCEACSPVPGIRRGAAALRQGGRPERPDAGESSAY